MIPQFGVEGNSIIIHTPDNRVVDSGIQAYSQIRLQPGDEKKWEHNALEAITAIAPDPDYIEKNQKKGLLDHNRYTRPGIYSIKWIVKVENKNVESNELYFTKEQE